MKKITKRDVKFFVLGMLAFFVLEALYNWEENVASFKEGFKAGLTVYESN